MYERLADRYIVFTVYLAVADAHQVYEPIIGIRVVDHNKLQRVKCVKGIMLYNTMPLLGIKKP